MNPTLYKYYHDITQNKPIPSYAFHEFITLSNEMTGKNVQYRKGCNRRVKQAYMYLREYIANNKDKNGQTIAFHRDNTK